MAGGEAPDALTPPGGEAPAALTPSGGEAPDALAPPPGNPRFPLFDGLRAIAALSVLVYHAGYFSRANEGEAGLSPYLARLNVGVAIFFVISGFLLYRPMLAARAGSGAPIRLRDYARRRVLRIVPAYWVALTALALYPGLPGGFGHHWWAYYGFAQDYSIHTVIGGIGPAWSLGCEVVFYAVLPFLSIALDRLASLAGRRVWWQLELAVLGGLTLASVGWRAYADAHPAVPSSTFASTFGWFAVGMLLALASVRLHERPDGRLAALTRHAWAGWLVALAAFVTLCRGIGLGGGFVFLQHVSTGQDLAAYALSGVIACGLALPAAFDQRRGPLGRIVGSRVVAWLGLVSYGIYLYHYPVANALSGGVSSGGDSAVKFLWLAPATAAIAIAAAALSYYVIERPALRRKPGQSPRARSRPVSPPASASPSRAVSASDT